MACGLMDNARSETSFEMIRFGIERFCPIQALTSYSNAAKSTVNYGRFFTAAPPATGKV